MNKQCPQIDATLKQYHAKVKNEWTSLIVTASDQENMVCIYGQYNHLTLRAEPRTRAVIVKHKY